MDDRPTAHTNGVALAHAPRCKPTQAPGVRILLRQAITCSAARHAHQLAREIGARAILLCADAIEREEELRQLLRAVGFPAIVVTRARGGLPPPGCESSTWVAVPDVHMTRAGQVKVALLVCLAKGVLSRFDRVICLTGIDGSGAIDALLVVNLGTESELFSSLETLALGGDLRPEVFERVLSLATQLAVEGREGRPVGAIFVVGDSARVLAQSRSLVLNPFLGHPEAERNILDPALEETVKGFAALDGALVVRGDGVVLTAGTQLVPAGKSGPLPKGLGTRHAAAAAITASTDAAALAISQSTGTVSVFKSGRMITDIHKPVNGCRLLL
jgi:DNA integrity scanning protein DisA with diadenylate cyclase activity